MFRFPWNNFQYTNEKFLKTQMGITYVSNNRYDTPVINMLDLCHTNRKLIVYWLVKSTLLGMYIVYQKTYNEILMELKDSLTPQHAVVSKVCNFFRTNIPTSKRLTMSLMSRRGGIVVLLCESHVLSVISLNTLIKVHCAAFVTRSLETQKLFNTNH